jgi:hypothetical protein
MRAGNISALSSLRPLAGALIGVASWPVCAVLLPWLPSPIRFVIAWLLFTFGPGAAAGAYLTRDHDPLRRVIVLLGLGSAATPVFVVLLGKAGLLSAYPYLVTGMAGAGIAAWTARSGRTASRTPAADLWASAGLVIVAAVTGAIVFWHRLVENTDGIQVFGLYDSMDLSYYAVMAAEATHTVPPTASFYSGHALNAAYYPQLILTMVHRFADVPLLPIYFRYSWPAFLALGALSGFALVRSVATTAVAVLAMLLILVAGDFSYLAAWLLPHATDQWDYLLWPTNFLSPTMEVLHFNTWTPSLPVFFGALYAAIQSARARSIAWAVVSGLLLAALFQFKPFAYIVSIGALFMAALIARGDRDARRAFAAAMVAGVLFALPFAYGVATQQDRRSRFLIDFFLLPRRMLLKTDLTAWLEGLVNRVMPVPPLRPALFLLAATLIFFAGGLGIRWLGLRRVWRAIALNEGDAPAGWRLIAWVTVVGVLLPFALVTDPYVDTLQFYQTGLYMLWIFTAAALVAFARAHPRPGAVVIAAAVLVSLPSSIHFLQTKWTDNEREPRVAASRGEVAIADYLRTTDPEATVVLHDRPAQPSLLAILSERRVVLGWGHPYYAVGSAGRLRDVNAFFDSAGRDAGQVYDLLGRYQVTHVVVAEHDRVHPDVLQRLKLLLQFPEVSLYAVPAAGAQP